MQDLIILTGPDPFENESFRRLHEQLTTIGKDTGHSILICSSLPAHTILAYTNLPLREPSPFIDYPVELITPKRDFEALSKLLSERWYQEDYLAKLKETGDLFLKATQKERRIKFDEKVSEYFRKHGHEPGIRKPLSQAEKKRRRALRSRQRKAKKMRA